MTEDDDAILDELEVVLIRGVGGVATEEQQRRVRAIVIYWCVSNAVYAGDSIENFLSEMEQNFRAVDAGARGGGSA